MWGSRTGVVCRRAVVVRAPSSRRSEPEPLGPCQSCAGYNTGCCAVLRHPVPAGYETITDCGRIGFVENTEPRTHAHTHRRGSTSRSHAANARTPSDAPSFERRTNNVPVSTQTGYSQTTHPFPTLSLLPSASEKERERERERQRERKKKDRERERYIEHKKQNFEREREIPGKQFAQLTAKDTNPYRGGGGGGEGEGLRLFIHVFSDVSDTLAHQSILTQHAPLSFSLSLTHTHRHLGRGVESVCRS